MSRKRITSGVWQTDYHLATVLTLTQEQAHLLVGIPEVGQQVWHTWIDFQPRDLIVKIDYPLDRPVKVLVSEEDYVAPNGIASFGRFLLSVAHRYQDLYREPDRYGIWGHTIEELFFERITVKENGTVELFVGSM